MLQRIQSVYLFVSSLALGLMFAFPVSNYYGEFHTLRLNLLKVENLVPGSEDVFHPYFTLPLAVFVCLICVLTVFSIFKFKNRKIQLKVLKISILLNIVLIVGIFFIYSKLILSQINVDEEYSISAFLPLFSLVFLVMAFRGVKKDEDLIRSTDRLR